MLSRQAQATLLLLGTIVGAGMFGIPFVFAKAGFGVGVAELLALAAVTLAVNLAYADVVLAAPAFNYLPGYVSLYFGRRAGWVSLGSYVLGIVGTLLAYVILGGAFLQVLLGAAIPNLHLGAGPLLFFLFGTAVIYRGVRFEGWANALLTALLILAVLALAIYLSRFISISEYGYFNIGEAFLPYGVILFAMAGSAVIPDVCRLLNGKKRRDLKRVVFSARYRLRRYILFLPRRWLA